MNNKVVVSMSGGLDSTMLAAYWLGKGYEVKGYAFDYGQKHDIELRKLKANVKFLQSKGLPISLQIINLRDCFSDSTSSLHKQGEDIPKGHYQDDNMKSTVIENRNIIFSSIIYGKALSWSKKTDSNVVISLGIHAGDHAVYPDTTKESFEAAAHTFKISNWGSEKVSYEAPFVNFDKSQVLAAGTIALRSELNFTEKEMNKVLKNTHSCYDPDNKGRSCGKCGTCTERIEAFEKLGYVDPIEYQS